MKKKILYIDMDNVLVDFITGIDKLDETNRNKYKDDYDNVPGIFSLMAPMDGAIESFNKLAEKFDTFILSTAPWGNPTAWHDKVDWVKKYLGEKAHKRLILTHRKDLNKGDFLIDDRDKNGAANFEGELILFGSVKYKNWNDVVNYLLEKE